MKSKLYLAIATISVMLMVSAIYAQAIDSCVRRIDTVYIRSGGHILKRYDTVKVVQHLNRRAERLEDTMKQIKEKIKPDEK